MIDPNGYGPYDATHRLARIAHSTLATLGLEDVPIEPAIQRAGLVEQFLVHLQFFTVSRLKRIFGCAGFDEVGYEGRTFMCRALLSEGLLIHGALVRANAWAGSCLPSVVVSGWMFVLRARGRAL